MDREETDKINQGIGQLIRARRLELGIHLNDLAKKLGLTAQQLQRYELGYSSLSSIKLVQFAQLLDVQVSYFFNEIYDFNTQKNIRFISEILSLCNNFSPKNRKLFLDLAKALTHDDA
jgi:transcriptional regulator with XRE-family HTH domain